MGDFFLLIASLPSAKTDGAGQYIATSGSNGIGDYGANLQALAPNAKVLTGKRFSTNVSAEELKNWADKEM